MLVDQTNYEIPLRQHGDFDDGSPACLHVDADQDSSFDPAAWVYMSISDSSFDSETIKLTYEEAGLLHDRLGLILGRDRPI